MLVQISEKGKKVLENKKLAQKLLYSIIQSKEKLDAGEIISVDGESLSVQRVAAHESIVNP